MARLPASTKASLTSNYSDIVRPTSISTAFPTSSQTAAQVASDIDAAENPMSSVEQPSYHWRFFITPDLQRGGGGSSTQSAPDGRTVNDLSGVVNSGMNSSDVTIAETGLTGFNLVSMEVDTIAAPNFLSRNTGYQKFNFTINEPYGATLPDKIFLASKTLGVRNFMKCPYHLSVDFLGYDPDSGAPKRPVEKTWTWRVMIIKLETSLTELGASHKFEAIGYNELGNLDQFSLVDVPFNIDIKDGQGTIGEVMEKLQQKINENLEKRYNVKNGGTVPHKIVIKDEPYDASVGAEVASPFKHKFIRDEKHLDSSRNQEKLQISRGTDLAKIVDYLMSSSDTAVKLINPANDPENLNGEQKPQSTIHRVDCEVTLDDFDAKTREYVRTFTFTVRATNNVRAVGSAQTENAAAGNAAAKLNFAKQQLLLKKQYDYMFTGKNTEVLNMDVNLNFMFNVAASLYDGHIFQEMASPGIQFDEKKFIRQSENQEFIKREDGQDLGAGGGMSFYSGKYIAEDLEFNNSVLPMSFIQDGKDPRYNVQPGIESTNTRGRSVYGMILNQLYGTFDGNLQNIDLEIRGDPYWLGLDNTSSPSTKSTAEVPNFINGEHMFLLKFQVPQGIDEEGKPILRLSDMYSGFYATIRVNSKFINGQFTQTLTATRIPIMSVTKLLGGQ